MTSLLLAALTIIASHPDTSSVPLGAQRVAMQTLTLQASCDQDATVTSLTVRHSGLGASGDIERVYLMEGTRRVSRTAALSNNPGAATLRLPSLVIPACKTRTLTVMADIARDASPNAEHRVGIASSGDIVTDSSGVTLIMEKPGAPARVAPVSDGTIRVEYLPVLTSTTYGAGRTLLRMRLTAEDEDQVVYSVTLTNDGKAADTDLQRLSLGTRSATLTNVLPSLTGDKATFTFDPPLRLDRGEDILLLLTGDVRASRRKTIDFSVEEPSDIVAGSASR